MPNTPSPTELDQNTIDLDTVDLTEPAWFVDGPPRELFRRMRATAPILWTERSDSSGFWNVTRGEDIVTVSKRPRLFSSHMGGVWADPNSVAPLALARNLIIFKDPPEHIKYRAIVQSTFTPSRVSQLKTTIRQGVVTALKAVLDHGRFDVVQDLAIPIPLSVIARLLGAPQSDIPLLESWTTRLDHAVTDSAGGDGVAVLSEMGSYFADLLPRQAEDADTLVGAVYQAEVDGQRLTDEEIMLFFGILVFAGNDTTRSSTAGGLRALIENPDQLAILAADPSLIPNAVEEILRWVTPLNYFARTATEDTKLGDTPISEGDKLLLWYASGSRDERIFPEPDRFDVTRVPGNHFAFGGGGRHFCLGAPLARLELRIILEEVVRRMTDLKLAGPVVPATSMWVNGLSALPATFSLRH